MRRTVLVLLLLACWEPASARAGNPPRRDWDAVELTGQATDYWFSRNWRDRYWREDFTFLLKEEGGKTWRIISREPTPVYSYRMGTTYTDIKVDWKAKPRVKVVGVKAIDRIPADFYDFKLDEPLLATALIVLVETGPNNWKEFYVSNWFHQWGERADKVIFRHYADKKAPYDIYGYVRGQVAPFEAKSQAVLDRYKDDPSLKLHGLVRSTKNHPFGYEIELIHLVGRDVKTGGPAVLYGDGKTIPLLDGRKPEKN